jgi:hypothetical protein
MKGLTPMEDTESFWHYAANEFGFSSKYHRTGKWIIYVPDDELDDTWETVAKAVSQGIAPFAKCSTARPNPRQESHGSKIIVVYVHDFHDETADPKVLASLRQIGIKGKLKFKRDAETFDGIYGKNSFWMYSRIGTNIVRYKWNLQKEK